MRGAGMWGAGALLASGVAALGAVAAVAVVPIERVAMIRSIPHPAAVHSPYPADSLSRSIVARDLFQSDRRPAGVPYDPSRGAAPPPDGPPKPQLALTGMVWGAQPEAVIEGLPTTDGPRVVRVGDVVGGLTVRRMRQGRVVVAGMDTTWTLVVKEPWR